MKFSQLDKWKYTNLETTVYDKAPCVTPLPEIVVLITRFSGKNSSSCFLRAGKKYLDVAQRIGKLKKRVFRIFKTLIPYFILFLDT